MTNQSRYPHEFQMKFTRSVKNTRSRKQQFVQLWHEPFTRFHNFLDAIREVYQIISIVVLHQYSVLTLKRSKTSHRHATINVGTHTDFKW